MKRIAVFRALISVTLLSVAVFVLARRLSQIELQSVLTQLRALPLPRVLLAVALTAFNYLQLTGFDWLGLRYLKRDLPYRKVALAAFVGTAFGHNIGPAFASGGSIRYRFYSAWGLSARDVAMLMAFGAVTFSLGFCLLGGVVLVSTPNTALLVPALSPAALRAIGGGMLALAVIYLSVTLIRKLGSYPRRANWEVPSFALACGQALVASLDWLMMAAILSLLLPEPGLGYWALLRILLIAQFAGMISQVPGGLGVFESLMVSALTPTLSLEAVLGALIVYRILYFFSPLALAIGTLSASELWRGRERSRRSLPSQGKEALVSPEQGP